jgi:hypothetical protein
MKKIYFTVVLVLFALIGFAQSTTRDNGTSSTSSRNVSIKILKVFPNPATTFVVFEFQRNYVSGLALEIYNLPGKKIAAANNITSSTTIQLQNFYRGVYLYKLIDRNGKVLESGKFQVVK